MKKIKINKNYKIDRQGFSIIEVCIASAILLVLLIPIFTILSKGNSGTIHNRNEITARQYASNIIAYCNLIPFNSPELVEGEDQLDKLSLDLNNNDLIKLKNNDPINLNDIDPTFLKLIKSKKLTIKDIQLNELPAKYKLFSVKIEWLETGKTKNSSVEISELRSEL